MNGIPLEALKVPVRQTEALLSLSLALDLGMSRPMEHCMRAAILSVRFARLLGMPEEVAREGYFFILLRFLGCSADAHDLAKIVQGDEAAARNALTRVDWSKAVNAAGALLSQVGKGQPLARRARALA